MEDIDQPPDISTPDIGAPSNQPKKEKAPKIKTKCSCCEKDLTKDDKIGKPFAKYRKCTKCGGTTCAGCNENNICHECLIQTSVTLRPENLMALEEDTLRKFLDILHYPKYGFANFQKAHLVKQILTRFKVHETWDPTFYINSKTKSESPASMKKNQPGGEELDYTERKPSITQDHGSPKADRDAFAQELTQIHQIHQMRQKADIETKYDTPWTSLSGGASSSNSVSLHKITTPAYFDHLTIEELRNILHQYKEEAPLNFEKHELKFSVLQLWNREKKKAYENQQQVQYGSQGTYPGSGYSTPNLGNNRGGTPVQNRQPNVVKTISLEDIPSTSAIEKLPTYQMKTLLMKHKDNPEKYSDKEALTYAVIILWNKVKREALERQSALNDQNHGTIGRNRQWKSQETLDAMPPPPPAHQPQQQPKPQLQYTTPSFYRPAEDKVQPQYVGNVQRDDAGIRQFTDQRYDPRPVASSFQAPPPPPMPINSGPYNAALARSTPSINRYSPEDWQEQSRFTPQLQSKHEPYGLGPGQSSTLPRRNQQNDYREYRDPGTMYPQGYGSPQQEPRFQHQPQQMAVRPKINPVVVNVPPPPLVVHAISLQDLHNPEEISSLNMRQMLSLLEKYGVNAKGVTDKTYLEEHVRQLWFERNRPASTVSHNQQEMMQPIDRPLYTEHESNYRAYTNYQGGGGGGQRDRSYSTTSIEQQYASLSMSEQQQQHYGGYRDNVSEVSAPVSQQQRGGYNPQDDGYRRPSAFQPYKGGQERTYGDYTEPTSKAPVNYRELLPPPPPPPMPATSDPGNTRKPILPELCTICNARPLNSVLLNCGHRLCCSNCASRLEACPLCHQEIVRIITI